MIRVSNIDSLGKKSMVMNSVVDRHRIDADPDPNLLVFFAYYFWSGRYIYLIPQQ